MIGSESASALETTGGASISCGRLRTACETLSRTSLAASSKFLSKLNSIVMLLLPWLLEDVMFRIPSIELMAFSKGSVICDSIMSALAPA
ncbi:hypothetical protein D3C86_1215310 [compost metagenome]